MSVIDQLDYKLVRASVLELHNKSANLAKFRRETLIHARRERDAAKAEENTRLFTKEDMYGIYAAFNLAHQKQFERGQCHRLWSLLWHFVRGTPYRKVERKTDDNVHPSCLAAGLAWIAMEAALDEKMRSARNSNHLSFKKEQSVLFYALQEEIRAWLKVPAVTSVADVAAKVVVEVTA